MSSSTPVSMQAQSRASTRSRTPSAHTSHRPRWSRADVSSRRAACRADEGLSERQRAHRHRIPRSTLRHWERRAAGYDALGEFLERPEGEAFLRRLHVAAHLVFGLIAPVGIRSIGMFFKLAGLGPYLACSYGASRRATEKLESAVVAFGAHERARLSALMPHRKISVVLDETFHPRVMLVAIEPVSGFILVESYTPSRDGVEWAAALAEAKRDLDVEIVQATSDRGSAILSVVRVALGATSPDLFHVQHDITKGTAAPLAAAVRRAKAKLDEAVRSGQLDVGKTTPELEEAERHRATMSEAVNGIASAYHPYDLTDGAVRDAAVVERDLAAELNRARSVVVEAGLPDRSAKAVEKAARVIPDMVATVRNFHSVISERVSALELPPALKAAVVALLIPSIYVSCVAKRAAGADRRRSLRAVAAALRARLDSNAYWLALGDVARDRILAVAIECADFFQRSSSCVEGRNGHLSLYHHAFHRLTPTKLQALTVVANYFVRRDDDKTAAERFFGHAPTDLFEWLVERCDGPGRPAKPRARTRERSSTPSS